MRLRGHVVRSLQLVFMEDWLYASGQDAQQFDQARLWPRETPSREDGSINAQVLVSGPDSGWETIHRLHVAAIHEAKHRVWLVTPYFVPGEAARMALTSAAMRGLDVRVVVPAKSDSMLVSAAARSYYDELLASGVLIGDVKSGSLTVAAGSRMRGQADFGWDEPAKGGKGKDNGTEPGAAA